MLISPREEGEKKDNQKGVSNPKLSVVVFFFYVLILDVRFVLFF